MYFLWADVNLETPEGQFRESWSATFIVILQKRTVLWKHAPNPEVIRKWHIYNTHTLGGGGEGKSFKWQLHSPFCDMSCKVKQLYFLVKLLLNTFSSFSSNGDASGNDLPGWQPKQINWATHRALFKAKHNKRASNFLREQWFLLTFLNVQTSSL